MFESSLRSLIIAFVIVIVPAQIPVMILHIKAIEKFGARPKPTDETINPVKTNIKQYFRPILSDIAPQKKHEKNIISRFIPSIVPA